jgi:hypothetical protein
MAMEARVSDLSRNDPCPCGSGRKYKNCCLGKESAGAADGIAGAGAARLALDWLAVTYPDELEEAIEHGFYAALETEEREALETLPSGLQAMIDINESEWLLADARLDVGERGDVSPPRAMELVLGPGGPPLSAVQRRHLESLGTARLRLYDVVESHPGTGLLLQDVLDPEGPPARVRERTASKSLVRGDVMGARVLPEGDALVLSGAIYNFTSPVANAIREDLREALREARGRARKPADPMAVRGLVTTMIVDAWLRLLANPPEIPELVDASTGDALMLVTDHYEVLDWDVLARALAAEPDVEGTRARGWVRLDRADEEGGRSLLAINLGKQEDRIEPFARTLRGADEGREWLQRVAGASLRFLVRDSVDPRTLMRQMAEKERGKGGPGR